jgi:two-component system nitrogen regulation sensor histidine kinase NtrY
VTLRTRIVAYIVALHVVLAAAGVFLLLERKSLLFAVEALFVVSVFVSIRLVRAMFVPLDLIQTGAELIAERDFTSRFVPVGQPEMDRLIDVYNRMIDRLREERLKAEEQHHLLDKLVEASPAGIVICDFDGNVERVNPSARRFLTGDRSELFSLAPGESKLVGGLGAQRLKISRAEFRDRGFTKSFYVIEELTEELRLLEKASYEKLIRMMSHEVNNSVGAVRSLLESSLRYAPQVGETDREDYVSALTIASARIDALNRFMTAFADVVRIPPPRKSRAPVADAIRRVVGVLRPELEERAIEVRLALEPVEAEIDASQFEQVLLNVFRNAMESVSREGTIDVALRDGSLTIADSGAGISEEHRAQLFTPFFTTKRDGRGLGLTVIHDILASHGFDFELQNRREGGAEFVVRW